MSHLNDNVFQNIDRISVKLYDKDSKFHKSALPQAKKIELAQDILEEHKDFESQNKVILRSLDKILIAHRNSKLFLFMMSGPFFILMTIFKYLGKGLFYYYLYKKMKTTLVKPGESPSVE